MDKNTSPKRVPGIYSTSLVNSNDDDATTTTVYHPLKKRITKHQLSIDSPTAYNYRSRANSNIIERRFSNVEPPVLIAEPICK
jgi:hypothetical protein